MRTSGDCVWEKQHIWNIPDGLKKVIAGVVTVSLLVGIGDAVSMVPLQEESPAEAYIYYQGFKIDQEGMICGFDPAKSEMMDGYLELPSENCIGIRRGTFSGVGTGIFEIYIPENIQNIENGAFSELGELTWIEAGGTGEYTARDGILFSGTELAAFPAGRTGIFEMPKDVTSIRASAFANTNLDKIDMRNCISILCDEGIFGDGAGCEIMEGKNGI